MGYFNLHPERQHMQAGRDGGDMSGQLAQAEGGLRLFYDSDMAESVYSPLLMPPALPKQAHLT